MPRLGDRPYLDSYERLRKDRIGHVHCKDVARKPDGSGYQWAAIGRGLIDWTGQFYALKRDGYQRAVSLETLARRWHARRVEPAELGGNERAAPQSRRIVLEQGRDEL